MTTRNMCLRVEFDGTDFHGWQAQTGLRTVQSVLTDAVQRVVRHPVEIHGSGRTDAGVHAAAHVDSFHTSSQVPGHRMRLAINARLPDDVRVLDAREVAPHFDPTTGAVSKLYRYRVYLADSAPADAGLRRQAFHYRHRIDDERIAEAAARFVGRHDFRSMTPLRTVRQTTVRTVLRCSIHRHSNELRIDIEGDGFLHNQVRTMAGTLLEAGRGRFEPADISRILESRDRQRAGSTAPAHGLVLMWVRYPAELLRAPDEGGLPSDTGGPSRADQNGDD